MIHKVFGNRELGDIIRDFDSFDDMMAYVEKMEKVIDFIEYAKVYYRFNTVTSSEIQEIIKFWPAFQSFDVEQLKDLVNGTHLRFTVMLLSPNFPYAYQHYPISRHAAVSDEDAFIFELLNTSIDDKETQQFDSYEDLAECIGRNVDKFYKDRNYHRGFWTKE